MQHLYNLLILLLVSACGGPHISSLPVELSAAPCTTPLTLIVSGQSNAVNEQPFDWDPPPNLQRWEWRPAGKDQGEVGHLGAAFVVPDPRIIGFGDAAGWAVARANPSRPVYVVIVGRNWTAIANWLPDGPRDPDMYATLKANTEAALAKSGDREIDGFLWWQGERDGEEEIPDYVVKFNALHARLRQEKWFPSSTPVIVMGVSTLFSPKVSAMNATLSSLAAQEPNTRLFVSLAGMQDPLWEDYMNNIHATPAGYAEAGRLAAETLQSRLSCAL